MPVAPHSNHVPQLVALVEGDHVSQPCSGGSLYPHTVRAGSVYGPGLYLTTNVGDYPVPIGHLQDQLAKLGCELVVRRERKRR